MIMCYKCSKYMKLSISCVNTHRKLRNSDIVLRGLDKTIWWIAAKQGVHRQMLSMQSAQNWSCTCYRNHDYFMATAVHPESCGHWDLNFWLQRNIKMNAWQQFTFTLKHITDMDRCCRNTPESPFQAAKNLLRHTARYRLDYYSISPLITQQNFYFVALGEDIKQPVFK